MLGYSHCHPYVPVKTMVNYNIEQTQVFNSKSYLCVFICIFCSCVLIFVMLYVIHVNGHGIVMTSCTPWYCSCNIVKLIICIIVSNVVN